MKKIIFLLMLLISTAVKAGADMEKIGDYVQVMIPAYAFGLTMNENDENHEGPKQFLKAFISMQLTVETLKKLTEEKRPDYEEGDKKDSFPSGHTASAFLGASFIHKRYGIKSAIVPYTLASLVGYTRIQADKHHVNDVLAGALLSSLYGFAFTDKYNTAIYCDGKNAEIVYKTKF